MVFGNSLREKKSDGNVQTVSSVFIIKNAIKVTELKNAKQAQNAPSTYATFNLVYNGKLLVDHYISNKGFLNIIERGLRLID